jgi:hypothetical protein
MVLAGLFWEPCSVLCRGWGSAEEVKVASQPESRNQESKASSKKDFLVVVEQLPESFLPSPNAATLFGHHGARSVTAQ